MNPRDRLQYALYLQRLHELFVIKENIAFQYQNAHYNKAAEQIDKVVDKCLDNNIKAVVDGTHNLETPNLDHVISGALSSQQKMLVKTEDRYIQSAVEQNTKEFTRFIQNRIEKENYSLQAKIQKEYEKKKYQDMSDEQAKKLIRQKFQDSARKRSKNIVKDALHTNQSQISWTYNVNNGMKYKVWMNGQSESGVRDWHIKSKIYPVEIDDFFDIFGPKGHVQMMYPGDLNGGAENVANCKCWLRYTNIAPSNLKPRGTIQVNPNVKLENENATVVSANTETKGRTKKPRDDESTSNEKEGLFPKIHHKIGNIKNRIQTTFKIKKNNFLSNFTEQYVSNLMKKARDYSEDFKNNPEKTKKILSKKYPIPADLLLFEKHFIEVWGVGSYPLTNYLRNNVYKPEKLKYFIFYNQRLNSAINKYDNIKEFTMLHRRTNSDFYIVDVGKVGVFNTPISTTFNKYSNEDFGKFHTCILAPVGSNGAYLEDIMSKHLGHDHYSEWLLPINTEYRTLYKNYETKEAVIILLN